MIRQHITHLTLLILLIHEDYISTTERNIRNVIISVHFIIKYFSDIVPTDLMHDSILYMSMFCASPSTKL
jgi:hypothetical protein